MNWSGAAGSECGVLSPEGCPLSAVPCPLTSGCVIPLHFFTPGSALPVIGDNALVRPYYTLL